MSTISTAIELTDRMSSPLHSITSALDATLNVFENFKASTNTTFDDSKIISARIAIDKAKVSVQNMSDSMNNASGSTNNFRNNINNASDSQEIFNRKLQEGTTASSGFLKSLMGYGVVQKLFSTISSQIGSAISRMDTMNNYPKVMSNLGISSDQSTASIQMLSTKLKGLPTALNDAASSVQKFTAVNGSVGKSTKMFLALNNAILAGGGSAEIQASALEQLSQSYSKGKPDMMEWRTAMTAMPAQLKQVAKAMGYVNADELGQALRTGKTSMNDFMNTIIQLNEKGSNGFASFEEQAKNATGGFATQIANMKTAISRGIANMIEGINNGLSAAGFNTIQTNIANFGNAVETALTKIGNAGGKIIVFLSPALNLIKNVYTFISSNWSLIAPIIGGIVAAIALYNAALGVHAIFVGISTFAENLQALAAYKTAAAFLAQVNPALIAASSEYAYAVAAAQATVAQGGFNSALFACPLTWILIIIIAVIAAIYLLVAAINKITGKSISATGIIFGAIMIAVAGIWNAFLGLLDVILGIINYLVNPFITFANFLANVFKDPIASIIHLFGSMADNVLGIIEAIAKALDKVFGSNLAGAVQGWRSGLNTKVEALAESKGNGKYQEVAQELNLSSDSLGLKRMEYGKSWNMGYSAGQGLEDKIGNIGNSLKNSVGDALSGLDDTVDLSSLPGSSATTANNTGKIKDSLKTSEEDLKYLRDLAEQETINRFTTAEIKVEMTNNNNINNDMDIDGIVDNLTNGVNEAMEKAAEGVHS